VRRRRRQAAPKRPCTALGTRRAPTARTFSPLPSPLPPFFFLLSLCCCLQVSVPACGARLSLLPPSARASRRATSSPPSPFLSSPSLLLPLSLTRYVQGALRLPCFVALVPPPSRCTVRCARLAARNLLPSLSLPLPSSPLFLFSSSLPSSLLLSSSFIFLLLAMCRARCACPCTLLRLRLSLLPPAAL